MPSKRMDNDVQEKLATRIVKLLCIWSAEGWVNKQLNDEKPPGFECAKQLQGTEEEEILRKRRKRNVGCWCDILCMFPCVVMIRHVNESQNSVSDRDEPVSMR